MDINQAILALMSELSLMQIGAVGDDIDAVLQSVTSMRTQLDALEDACTQNTTDIINTTLDFVGDGARVIGPFTIPEGVYRIAADFTSSATIAIGGANIQRLSGECGTAYSETVPLFFSQGGREETVFRSSGCEALLEMTGTMSWHIVFEKVD